MTDEYGEWKDYPHDTRYEVSDLGLVRMKGRKVRKPSHTPFGYEVIVYKGTSKYIGAYVHRMVLEAFVGPCPEGCSVSHLNGKCTDNRLVNLQYETMKENIGRKVQHGTQLSGADHHNSKLSADIAAKIRATTDRTWKQLASEYKVHLRTIARIKSNETYKEI